ncbi:MAG: ThiF family adenylyltransferase [Parcubacteria group bacterium]|nr:ThiF family adenylyltransferase [Parcubacteria group bacterium]
MRCVLVGLGGIGSHLIEPLCRTLIFNSAKGAPDRLILIDGDTYEDRNRERQNYTSFGNKADTTRERLINTFPEISIETKPHFVTAENIFLFVREGDVVFLAVDNHATRKIVSDHTRTLENALLISGGNDEYDGNIQVYERRNGRDLTSPLTQFHPEIESPADKNPGELGCGELIEAGSPQLLTVNLSIATLMLNTYTLWLHNRSIPYEEVYFDLRTGNCRAVQRKNVLATH